MSWAEPELDTWLKWNIFRGPKKNSVYNQTYSDLDGETICCLSIPPKKDFTVTLFRKPLSKVFSLKIICTSNRPKQYPNTINVYEC